MAAAQTHDSRSHVSVFIAHSSSPDGPFAMALAVALGAYRAPKGMPLGRNRVVPFVFQHDGIGGDYDLVIHERVAASDKLVVICSPAARTNARVAMELETFRRAKGDAAGRNIIPVLVAGRPNDVAARTGEVPAFPDVLLSVQREPVAIDYTGSWTGRTALDRGVYYGAWYGLLASIFDIDREQIEERDRRQRRRRMTIVGAAAALTVTAIGASAVVALQQRNAAKDALIQARLAEAGERTQRKKAEVQTLLARKAEALARARRDTAVAERENAVRQARIATYRGAQAGAELLRVSRPDQLPLAARVALEVYAFEPSLESEQTVRAAAMLLPRLTGFRRDSLGSATMRVAGTGALVVESALHAMLVDPGPTPRASERTAVRFERVSPSGRIAFVRGRGSPDRIVEVATGRRLWTVPENVPVYSVLFSGNDSLIAFSTSDQRIAVWRLDTRRPVATLSADQRLIRLAALDPRGRFVATQQRNSALRVRRLSDGRDVLPPDSSRGLVAFSPDGRRMAVSYEGRQDIQLWDLATLTALDLAHLPSAATELAFSADSRHLVSVGSQEITLFEAWSSRLRSLLVQSATASSASFHPGTSRLAAALYDGTTRVWDVETGTEVLRVVHPKNTAVSFLPDGTTLATRSNNGELRLWGVTTAYDAAAWKPLTLYQRPWVSERGDSARFVTQGGVLAMSLQTEATRVVLPLSGVPIAAAMSVDGRFLARVVDPSPDAETRRFHLELWDVQRRVRLGRDTVSVLPNELQVGPSGRTLVALLGGRATIWRASEGQLNRSSLPTPDTVLAVHVSANERYVATQGRSDVHVWTVDGAPTGAYVASGGAFGIETLKRFIGAFAFSPSGRRWAVTVQDSVAVYNSDDGSPLHRAQLLGLWSYITFGQHESRLALAGGNGAATIDLASRSRRTIFLGSGASFARSITSDFAYLVASRESTVEVWRVEPTQRVAVIPIPATTRMVDMVANGRLLMATGDDEIRFWRWRLDELIGPVCDRVAAVARAELRRFIPEPLPTRACKTSREAPL